MVDRRPKPTILDSVDKFVYRACAVLAGAQLDLFTPLKDGPLSEEKIAESIGVDTRKLRPLLYALVVVGLLTLKDGKFANSAEADHYLVRGRPTYQGERHKYWSDAWSAALLAGNSIRTGAPQKGHDYATMPEDDLEEFLNGLYPWSYDSGSWLAENFDFSSCDTILDAGGGAGAPRRGSPRASARDHAARRRPRSRGGAGRGGHRTVRSPEP